MIMKLAKNIFGYNCLTKSYIQFWQRLVVIYRVTLSPSYGIEVIVVGVMLNLTLQLSCHSNMNCHQILVPQNGKTVNIYFVTYFWAYLYDPIVPYTHNFIPIASFPRFQGNHYVQLNESGNITILSSLETSCSRIHDEAKIGFYYKLTDNSSVSKILIMYIIFDRQEWIMYQSIFERLGNEEPFIILDYCEKAFSY